MKVLLSFIFLIQLNLSFGQNISSIDELGIKLVDYLKNVEKNRINPLIISKDNAIKYVPAKDLSEGERISLKKNISETYEEKFRETIIYNYQQIIKKGTTEYGIDWKDVSLVKVLYVSKLDQHIENANVQLFILYIDKIYSICFTAAKIADSWGLSPQIKMLDLFEGEIKKINLPDCTF